MPCKMRFNILTIFPEYFQSPIKLGMLRIAQEKKLIKINVHNIRDYTDDIHRSVDDNPYGGGPGMVMKPEPFYKAISKITNRKSLKGIKKASEIILFSPKGKKLNQKMLMELSKEKRFILICGRYEGIDERVRESLSTKEISIGDYILSGGESASLIFIEAITRLIPGVLGDKESLNEETFSRGLLEYPQYTRPKQFLGMEVPEVLLSGNHKEIKQWRMKKSLEETIKKREDILNMINLTDEEKETLGKIGKKKL